MTPDGLFARVLLIASEVALTWCAVCYVAGRGREVRASWEAGTGWVAARRAVWVCRRQAAGRLVRRLPRAVFVGALRVALRAHGQHRAGVTL